MKQIPFISLVGTTATGKTATAFALAHEISTVTGRQVWIISADSRQVYKDIPLLSGADVPATLQSESVDTLPFPFFTNARKTLQLHGVGILDANQEWSVAQFREFTLEIVHEAARHDAVVFVVGGTGLYHLQLTVTDSQLEVPPNKEWRQESQQMSVAQLQTVLEKENPEKFAAMNNSDRNNPRRLQRAVEVARAFALYPEKYQAISHTPVRLQIVQHVFGLHSLPEALEKAIAARVQERIAAGVVAEVAQCLTQPQLSQQLTSSLGFSDVKAYLSKEKTLEELVKDWTLHELQYAKRQKTWWNAQPTVAWFESGTSVKELLSKVLEVLLIA